MTAQPSTTLHFTKGHGTENDFVLLPDPDGRLAFDADLAARIANRRSGIGADGVIRVVPTEAAAESEIRVLAPQASWFMDYRNADGSLAQMCGNGTRVFAAYLRREGWQTDTEFAIATRDGIKGIRCEGDLVATTMGAPRLAHPEQASAGSDCVVQVPGLEPFPGISVDIGNPHTVIALPESVALESVNLEQPPIVEPTPPEGTNVEVVRVVGPAHIAMRVHERGSGETRSCGTGVCAAVLATTVWSGAAEIAGEWTVDVRGGRLWVRPLPGGEVELVGPAALVADGVINLDDLSTHHI